MEISTMYEKWRIKVLEDELIRYPDDEDQHWDDGRARYEADGELKNLRRKHLTLEE
jgi:hypothetical protein